jgi:hypothetical protein
VPRFKLAIFSATVLLHVLAHASAVRAADRAIVRLSTSNQGAVYVGQRVTLIAELLVQGTFDAAPAFDLPKLPGALLMQSSDRPVIGSEDIDGATYVTQRHELFVVSMRAGTTQIPSFEVRVAVKPSPDKPAEELRVQAMPLAIEAKMPPGAEHLASIISSKRVTAEQTWNSQPGERVKVGTSFTRAITLSAADVPSMAFPPLPAVNIDHLKAYPKPPVVEDTSERGEFTGRRIDAVVYVCASPGKVHLPALSIPWWNLEENRLEQIKLPGMDVEIEADAEEAASTSSGSEQPSDSRGSRESWAAWRVAGLALVVAIVAAVVWWQRQALAALWQALVAGPVNSDRRFRTAAIRASRRDDPVATYKALTQWCDARRETPGVGAIEDDVSLLSADAQMPALVQDLQNAMLNGQRPWRGESLATALLSGTNLDSISDSRRAPIPPLNPTES